MWRKCHRGILLTTVAAVIVPIAAQATTVTGWNTDNVAVADTPADGVTGASIVYNETLNTDGSVPATAETSGQIVFTPPEAVSPGIKVEQISYVDSSTSPTDPLILDGCIMTSSDATCTSEFQSGKRIKQQMTGFEPVDLVFDIDSSSTEESTYQVFGRLINVTGESLDGFAIELGFGAGDDFVAVTNQELSFSTEFTAQPGNSGIVSTQYPFGLFGEADTNQYFGLDGFFDDERTGLEVAANDATKPTVLGSTDFYGNYDVLFDPWLSQDGVPDGLFWDFDDNDDTDALLMAWVVSPGVWELRRETTGTDGLCLDPDPLLTCGATLDTYFTGTFDDVVAELGISTDLLDVGAIEDLANLNLNYAITLGDLTGYDSFTIRTTVFPADTGTSAPVPLPAGAPLLAAGLGLLAWKRRSAKRRLSI